MAREPRIDYAGATHHIFVRGVNRSVIAVDEVDYAKALFLLERAVKRFRLQCHGWSYLPNHSHLVITTPHANISTAMHWLGTCTAQAFNRRHERSGHLYQGRFGSRLVTTDRHFDELARYLPRNPVVAGLCTHPEDWQWSSYAATAGLRSAPSFLDSEETIGRLGSLAAYTAWVAESEQERFLDENGKPRPPAKVPLEAILFEFSDQTIASAHYGHGYSKAAIARFFGVSPGQIKRRLA
jgi:REP element-mobilizing transposase RayT